MRVVAALLALVVIAGCGSDPRPKEPKPSATSAAPTLTVPTMPAQAKKHSPEGAAAFVKHYIDVFNYASNTGDVAELSRLSDPKCDSCQNYVRLYGSTYKAGGYFKRSDWSIGEIELEAGPSDTVAFAKVTAPPGVYRTSGTSREKPGTPESFNASFVVKIVHDQWRLMKLGRRTS